MTRGLFYWNARHNWGDQLSPLLVEHFTGIETHYSSPQTAEFVCVGSVLDVLPYGWDGIVAGSGLLNEGTSLQGLSRANVLGVRGNLTAAKLAYGGNRSFPITVGDPGLLADELVTARPVFDLGIVPHWSDHSLIHKFLHLAREFEVVVIPATTPPLEVVKRIGSCRKIVSSSLHGVVVADAFGIPRRAERFPAMFNGWEGGEYKFHDHASAIKLPMKFGEVQVAPRERVEELQVGLYEMFQRLKEELA